MQAKCPTITYSLYPLTQKTSCFPPTAALCLSQAKCCLAAQRDVQPPCPSLARGHCSGSCCWLCLLHGSAAACRLGCPGWEPREKTRQKGVATAGAWLTGPLASYCSRGRQRCWRAAIPPAAAAAAAAAPCIVWADAGGVRVQWEAVAWTAILNCSQEKGQNEGNWMFQHWSPVRELHYGILIS